LKSPKRGALRFRRRMSILRFGPIGGLLSLFLMVSIKQLFCSMKQYAFPRPPICLRCSSTRIWGHGFKDAYFDGYLSALPLKRYVCADCGCVYTMRPVGYLPRFHAAAVVILNSICHRIRNKQWAMKESLSRQRQYHWLRALRRNIKAHLGMDFDDLLDGFFELLHSGRTPVTRSR
jgi:hypothetical protein